jgi:ComF family protein
LAVNRSPLKRLALTVLEFFLPRLCLFCGVAVGEKANMAVCPECEGQIHWAASPLCLCCGQVFASREGVDRLCGPCQKEPPPFDRARAAAVYDGPPAEAIKRFKFNRQLAYLPVMQAWLRPLAQEMAAQADLIMPVPLHPRRLQSRGFNQALMLAQGLTELPLEKDVLIRERPTRPQIGLNPQERRENVKGAFAVPRPERVKRKRVLLVDDLFTTGATARECARVLRKAGAVRVEILTVARTKQD